MSVNKYTPKFENGILKQAVKPYTYIINKVLQEGTHFPEALFVWCYLQSLPDRWVLSPAHLMKHFKWKKDKVYTILNYLIYANLLVRNRLRNAQGLYAQTEYEVQDGEKFVNIQKHEAINKNAQPLLKKPCLDNPDTVKTDTINTIKRNKLNKENINTISCASESDARESFDRLWNVYPRKKDKKRAFDVWIKCKLYEKEKLILEKLSLQILNEDQWSNLRFIPYPETYLKNQRWEDEITPMQAKNLNMRKESGQERAMRMCGKINQRGIN